MTARRILFIFGTRPEAIKLCPVLLYLRRNRPEWRVEACVTAQHRGLLDQVLEVFDVRPDYDLNCMQPGQTLFRSTSNMLAALEPVLSQVRPDVVIVQGDTTTTFCGALGGFYAGVPVAHVEAGLRTGDVREPFPEELNRVLTGRIADLHFAATDWAAANLRAEGVAEESITVTGNPGIDAVFLVRDMIESGRLRPKLPDLDPARKTILVTAHRRESFGEGFVHICQALRTLAARPDVQVVYPVHPNPNVRRPVDTILRGASGVHLVEPLAYPDFVALLLRSYLALTDSGGIQEEAPSLGKPVLVMRDKTERPEAVEAGTARLVGTDEEEIVNVCHRLLDDEAAYSEMARAHNPYGDGRASERIAAALDRFFGDAGSTSDAAVPRA